MKISNKIIAIFAMVSVVMLSLAGCGSQEQKPTSVVNDMLTAVQAGDFQKVNEFVTANGNTNAVQDVQKAISSDNAEYTKAIFNKYKFGTPTQVNKTKDSATVKVKITSIDYMKVVSKTMEEVIQQAFSSATSEDLKSESDMDKFAENSILKNLKADDVELSTREVTLNLSKIDGKYKVVGDSNLKGAIIAGYDSLDKLSSESTDSTNSANSTKQ